MIRPSRSARARVPKTRGTPRPPPPPPPSPPPAAPPPPARPPSPPPPPPPPPPPRAGNGCGTCPVRPAGRLPHGRRRRGKAVDGHGGALATLPAGRPPATGTPRLAARIFVRAACDFVISVRPAPAGGDAGGGTRPVGASSGRPHVFLAVRDGLIRCDRSYWLVTVERQIVWRLRRGAGSGWGWWGPAKAPSRRISGNTKTRGSLRCGRGQHRQEIFEHAGRVVAVEQRACRGDHRCSTQVRITGTPSATDEALDSKGHKQPQPGAVVVAVAHDGQPHLLVFEARQSPAPGSGD